MNKRPTVSKKRPKLNTQRILCISDQHMPYEHPDMFKFLAAVKKKYKPTLVINGALKFLGIVALVVGIFASIFKILS